ncbi:acyl-CoA thioesterase [Neobacillus sp. SM06]|uniref:acyl-CoA thioesterase n=1 Tax=Neobacillus sp. SM06 TaxID=3422492 RepID=UPI003D2BFBCD
MFETIIVPRVSETDGAGHINNTTIPVWFEAGREEIFKLFTPDLSFQNWRMVIIHFDVDFIQQLYYGKKVTVKTWIKEIGNTSLKIDEEIHQDGKCCAKGSSIYVNFNFTTQKTERIPELIRMELVKHLYPMDDKYQPDQEPFGMA